MKLFKALEIYGKVRHKGWKKGHYITRNKWGNVIDENGDDWLVDFNIANDYCWEGYRNILDEKDKDI